MAIAPRTESQPPPLDSRRTGTWPAASRLRWGGPPPGYPVGPAPEAAPTGLAPTLIIVASLLGAAVFGIWSAAKATTKGSGRGPGATPVTRRLSRSGSPTVYETAVNSTFGTSSPRRLPPIHVGKY